MLYILYILSIFLQGWTRTVFVMHMSQTFVLLIVWSVLFILRTMCGNSIIHKCWPALSTCVPILLLVFFHINLIQMIQLEQSTQVLSIAKGRKRSLVSMWLPEKPEIGNQLLLWYSIIKKLFEIKKEIVRICWNLLLSLVWLLTT